MKKVKENSVRTTISITPSVYAKAQAIMQRRYFTKFSTLLHQLIREEWERRNLKKPERVTPAQLPADELPIVPFSDKTKRDTPGRQN